MSLVTVVGKKATSKKKVVRLRIINKVKNALNLAVTRVADVKDGKLVLDEALSRENLICRGVPPNDFHFIFVLRAFPLQAGHTLFIPASKFIGCLLLSLSRRSSKL